MNKLSAYLLILLCTNLLSAEGGFFLAPRSLLGGSQDVVFQNPQIEEFTDLMDFEKSQADFLNNIAGIAQNTRVRIKYKERGMGEVITLDADYYLLLRDIRTLIVKTDSDEKEVLLSDMLSVEVDPQEETKVAIEISDEKLENIAEVKGIISSDIKFEGFAELRGEAGDYQKALMSYLNENIQQIAEIHAPLSKELIVKKLVYAGMGSMKTVFYIEAETDTEKNKKIGIRLIRNIAGYSSEKLLASVNEEMDMFNKLRELNGVAISIKHMDDVFELEPVSMTDLLNLNVYAVTTGDFAYGKTLNKLAGREKKEAYKDVIKTIMRAWLLSFNKVNDLKGYYAHENTDTGICIGDLKGENFIKLAEKDFESQEAVVFIDFGDVQPFSFSSLTNMIKDHLLRGELKLDADSFEEGEYLWEVYKYIASFINEKGDSFISAEDKEKLINYARNFLKDHPRLETFRHKGNLDIPENSSLFPAAA